ncbi:MAG: type II toxin-antitoxin system VapC family toxin [Rhodothermia bacterium]
MKRGMMAGIVTSIHSNKDLQFVLDTNVVSEPVKRRPSPLVLDRLEREDELLAITSVVWHELVFGMYRMSVGSKRQTIEDYLRGFVAGRMLILPYDAIAAEWLATERVRLASDGKMTSDADGMIAAVAATRGLTLVTRNVDHFQYFDGLQIENWFE